MVEMNPETALETVINMAERAVEPGNPVQQEALDTVNQMYCGLVTARNPPGGGKFLTGLWFVVLFLFGPFRQPEAACICAATLGLICTVRAERHGLTHQAIGFGMVFVIFTAGAFSYMMR